MLTQSVRTYSLVVVLFASQWASAADTDESVHPKRPETVVIKAIKVDGVSLIQLSVGDLSFNMEELTIKQSDKSAAILRAIDDKVELRQRLCVSTFKEMAVPCRGSPFAATGAALPLSRLLMDSFTKAIQRDAAADE